MEENHSESNTELDEWTENNLKNCKKIINKKKKKNKRNKNKYNKKRSKSPTIIKKELEKNEKSKQHVIREPKTRLDNFIPDLSFEKLLEKMKEENGGTNEYFSNK